MGNDQVDATIGTAASQHPVDFDKGAMLCLVSETYPGVLKAILEAVQNAIDAGAKHVYVGVDQIGRRIVVCDDGSGITVEKQLQALATIGHSNKDAEPGTLGQFGLGMVAPVTKCDTMLVYSQPDPGAPVNCWTYREVDIRQQTSSLTIPYHAVASLPALPEPFTRSANEVRVHNRGAVVRWRTALVMEEVSRDSRISQFDPHRLAHNITEKLGGGLNAKGTTVLIKLRSKNRKIERVRVDPKHYTGKRLDTFVVNEADAGEVTFELYRAKPDSSGTRHGEVKFRQTGKASAITWQEMQRQVTEIEFNDGRIKTTLEALGSGYFEGTIHAAGIQLHHDRESFVHDEVVLWGLCSALITWYERVGSHYIEQEREQQQDARYTRLGQASLIRLRTRIQESPRLSQIFDSLGEVMPASKGNASSKSRDRAKPQGGSTGSTPRKRTVVSSTQHDTGRPVKSDGFIQFVYTVLDTPDLWMYDRDTGQLVLNIAHPLWVSMDDTNGRHTTKNDEYVQRFQEWLALELITLLVDDPKAHEYESGIEYICRRQEGYILILVLR